MRRQGDLYNIGHKIIINYGIRKIRKILFIARGCWRIFHNDLYLILYNKKFIICFIIKHFYQIKMINEFWIILFNIIK